MTELQADRVLSLILDALRDDCAMRYDCDGCPFLSNKGTHCLRKESLENFKLMLIVE